MTKWKRSLLAIALFAGTIWLGIALLESAGRRGLAGNVVQNNLERQTDATALFYTEIDRDILRPVKD